MSTFKIWFDDFNGEAGVTFEHNVDPELDYEKIHDYVYEEDEEDE